MSLTSMHCDVFVFLAAAAFWPREVSHHVMCIDFLLDIEIEFGMSIRK